MHLVVGLGNPGRKYAATRHNLGFLVLDMLAKRHQLDFSKEKFHSFVASGIVKGKSTILLKPLTYMNLSGKAVSSAAHFYSAELESFLVIADDVNLSLGRIRLRKSGSAGGHNGLKSVIEWLGTTEFPRLRLGIGPGEGDLTDFVLEEFYEDEAVEVNRMIETAADAVECFLQEGMEAAMNQFNRGEAGEDKNSHGDTKDTEKQF